MMTAMMEPLPLEGKSHKSVGAEQSHLGAIDCVKS